jgi:hypothetical protein
MDEIKRKRSIFEALGIDVDLIFADAEQTVVPARLQEPLHDHHRRRRRRRSHQTQTIRATVSRQDFPMNRITTSESAEMRQIPILSAPQQSQGQSNSVHG